MKRLFIGTFVDNDIFDEYLPKIKENFSTFLEGKWVENQNLHFTCKFLGDIEEKKIPGIKEALNTLLNEHTGQLEFSIIGAFPNKFKPRIIHAGIYNPGGVLFRLKNEVESRLFELGFAKEKKKFRPHITICRVKRIIDNPVAIFDQYRDVVFGNMPAFRIELVESTLTKSGPIYNIL